MENEISEFIQYLETHKLNIRDFDAHTDRQSGLYVVRAGFMDGKKFNFHASDAASVSTIKTLSQANLKAQFAEISEFRELFQLSQGNRYTLASMGDFGFCHPVQFTLEKISVGRYAQYDDCVSLIVKPKSARTLRSIQFYSRKVFAIWTGWVDVNTDPLGPATVEGPIISSRSRYLSCDERYMTDAIASVSQKPLIVRLSPQITAQQGVSNE